jgi:hypothetical protein
MTVSLALDRRTRHIRSELCQKPTLRLMMVRPLHRRIRVNGLCQDMASTTDQQSTRPV